MNLRPATKADLPAILEIYNDSILHSTAVYEYEVFTMEYIENWYEEKMRHGFPVWILEVDVGFAGFCSYGIFRSRAAYNTTREHSIYVHPQFQGKGYGRILLQKIEDLARENKVHVLIGGIDSANEVSILLHKKMGYYEVARMHEVAFKFGRWLDLVFVQKILQ